jgi:uncharacterized damage-inducible protein DinB
MTSTTSASPVAAPIAMIFSFNEDLALRALEGLTPDEMWKTLTERSNPMLWIAGHLVQTRAMLLRVLGDPVETGWGKVFDRGAAAISRDQADRYPSKDEIVRVMRETNPRLRDRLTALDDASLARPATLQVPGTKTIADELAFFALHDSYHTGQLAYLRKALGYPGLAG